MPRLCWKVQTHELLHARPIHGPKPHTPSAQRLLPCSAPPLPHQTSAAHRTARAIQHHRETHSALTSRTRFGTTAVAAPRVVPAHPRHRAILHPRSRAQRGGRGSSWRTQPPARGAAPWRGCCCVACSCSCCLRPRQQRALVASWPPHHLRCRRRWPRRSKPHLRRCRALLRSRRRRRQASRRCATLGCGDRAAFRRCRPPGRSLSVT